MGAQSPIAASLHQPTRRLLLALSRVDRNGDGYKTPCPICGGDLKVWEDEDGALLHCPAGCSLETVLEAVGLTEADLQPRSVLDPVTPRETDELIEAIRWGNFAEASDCPDSEASATVADSDGFAATDLGNGERLRTQYSDRLRYEPASGKWYAWSGTHWEPDATLAVDTYAAVVARGIYEEAGRATDEHRRRELAKHAVASESRSRQQAMIDSSRHMMAVKPDHWDTDPMLFNCSNGTIDLSTGRLLPHRPGDRITKVSPVAFDPSATCPTFDRFLCQVVPDEMVREFLQRSAGYGLTGLTVEQFFWFLFGLGANGKSTLTNIMQHIMADYSRTAAPKLLERSRERHPTELADLFGARLVVAHETQEGRALDETRVKQLTGGDPVAARFMRGDFFTFFPTHKIWMHGNHKPRIAGTDYAIWRRPLLVDFPVTIAPKDKDPRLLEKLKAEASGILNWMVVGCLTWQQMGIDPPASVIVATESYRLQEDRIGAFIAERCVQERGARERGGDLYKVYVGWCQDEDEDPVTLTAFGRSLNERGFLVVRSGGKSRVGIRLAAAAEQLEQLEHPGHIAP